MAGETVRTWPVLPDESCVEPGCAAAKLEGKHCVEHVATDEFNAAVERIRAGGEFDARGATIRSQRLEALLEALKDDTGRAVFHLAWLNSATFIENVDFAGAVFWLLASSCG